MNNHLSVRRRQVMTGTLWQLVCWTYDVQKADQSFDDIRRARHGFGRHSQTSKICQILQLGCKVDGGGGSYHCHPDADLVHSAVLASAEADLVIETAALGRSPDWFCQYEPCRVEPVVRGNGKIKMVYRGRRHQPFACLVNIVGDTQAEIDRADLMFRERYKRWVEALEYVYDVVSGKKLSSWKLHGLGVVARPWAVSERKSLTIGGET